MDQYAFVRRQQQDDDDDGDLREKGLHFVTLGPRQDLETAQHDSVSKHWLPGEGWGKLGAIFPIIKLLL